MAGDFHDWRGPRVDEEIARPGLARVERSRQEQVSRAAVIVLALVGVVGSFACASDRWAAGTRFAKPGSGVAGPHSKSFGTQSELVRPASLTRSARGKSTLHRVTIDLSRRETYWTLPVRDLQAVRVTDLEVVSLPTDYRLDPRQAVVRAGEPVEIVLTPPEAVRIRLSLTTRGTDLALKIAPRIQLEIGEPIDLTKDRVERAIRSFDRQVRNCRRQLALASAQHDRLLAWLRSPGNKPLDTVKVVRTQVESLRRVMATHQGQLLSAQGAYLTLRQIEQLVDQIHDTAEIHFAVRADEDADR